MPVDFKAKSVPRFWAKVDKRGPDECWEWKASKFYNGYGHFYFIRANGKSDQLSHHYAWELHFGEIPRGYHVLHRCDNPGCVNPKHLFLGTHQDNMKDMDKKGRRKNIRGISCPWSKLKETDILEIRNIYATQPIAMKEIAKRYNVTEPTIHSIIHGKTWVHVSGGECCVNTVQRGSLVRAILTEKDVKEIRRRYDSGQSEGRELAQDYGVSLACIYAVTSRRTWRHI